MTKNSQCHSWRQQEGNSKSKQEKMNDNIICVSGAKNYLVESFLLNSPNRVVARKGKGHKPDPAYAKRSDSIHQLSMIAKQTGRKMKDVDLETLETYFETYVEIVNMLLERVYTDPQRAQELGERLSEYRGYAYNLLRKESDLCYRDNDEINELTFERLHRNALEQVGRIVLANFTRRQLVKTAIKILCGDEKNILSVFRRRRIPSALIRIVRDACGEVKDNGQGYHYTMGALRQIRLAVDRHILDSMELQIGWRSRQRKKISSLLKDDTPAQKKVLGMVVRLLKEWSKNGYPFRNPKIRKYSLDFSASTENSPGQGYWFTCDTAQKNEIFLHLKLPPGIDGTGNDKEPYKRKTLTFRFLNWLPRAASKDISKAKKAEANGDEHRAEQLRFRAAKFTDMSLQLMNTIEFQHVTHRLTLLKQRKQADPEEIIRLMKRATELRSSRRSAPPRILLRGHRAVLQIPFLSPNGEVSSHIFGDRKYTHKAGADRGLRVPVALSVEKKNSYEDLFLRVEQVIKKREQLRKQAYSLQSEAERKKNNWDKKRSGQSYPGHILKKDRHIDALWRKVRRLDREIARLVASKTVWFCEKHLVKKVFFEDLRSFQGHKGSRDLSYNLSSNLWGRIIDTVRYMREQLGHSPYSVWTVNPRYTSQTCHVCGGRGIRVEKEGALKERKGGEYFYCEKCNEHFHADINAARNIIHVQDNISSVVPGRTT